MRNDIAKTIATTLIVITICLVGYGMLNSLWPNHVPFELYDMWLTEKGVDIGTWLTAAIPLFSWAIGANFLFDQFKKENDSSLIPPRKILVSGTLLSLWAGIFEELRYRWSVFFFSMFTIVAVDWIFFGFIFKNGLIAWLHSFIAAPIADFFTLGLLHDYLFHEAGWFVGAAMLTSNATFRDGHKYQGMLGYINSWFLGMAFFWFMFTYGLASAIVIHFTYNFAIYAYAALAESIKRLRNPI